MEESDKLPLKRVELSLSKFNEVAIPHHLDLLRQHRANIINHEERGEWARARAEQAHARRAAARLRALLAELTALRGRVRAEDLRRFDAATQRSRDRTLRAILDYLETSPLSANRRSGAGESESGSTARGSVVSSDSVGVLPLEEDGDLVQLQVDEQDLSLKEREDMLAGWSALQEEVHALHDAWRHVHAAATGQSEQVSAVATHVEEAADNVQSARTHLSVAERVRGGWVGAACACGGALAGGPAGLLLGLKAGAAAALAGGLLAYLGVRALPPAPAPTAGRDKDD